jgi:AcrR family transcriptional regulator
MTFSVSESSTPALTADQAQVVLALAQGTTITAAAAAAKLNRGTIYTWLKTEKGFEEAVRQARAEYILTLRDDLKDLSGMALATLRSLLTDAHTPSVVRMHVALAILERPQSPHPSRNLPEYPGAQKSES